MIFPIKKRPEALAAILPQIALVDKVTYHCHVAEIISNEAKVSKRALTSDFWIKYI